MTATPLVVTPLARAEELGCRLYLKDETRQVTRAFKVRGSTRKLERIGAAHGVTVVTASTGNHGLGLATAAAAKGTSAVVYVPAATPKIKLQALDEAGAKVVLVDGDYDDAHARAVEAARGVGRTYVSSFDDLDVIAGHRTLFDEIERVIPRPRRLYVPVGGGGLLAAALTSSLGKATEVVGVELDAAPAMHKSLIAGRRVLLPSLDASGAEGLMVRRIGAAPWDVASRARPRVELVNRTELDEATAWIWRCCDIRAEAAGAASVAAALRDTRSMSPLPRDQGVVCVVSGGNVGDVEWRSALERGSSPGVLT